MRENEITQAVIGAAIEVHRILGPGMIERPYEDAVCREFHLMDESGGISTQNGAERHRLPQAARRAAPEGAGKRGGEMRGTQRKL